MMVGQVIRYFLFIIILMHLFSCINEKENQKSIDSILIEYIDEELRESTNKNSLLLINRDSINNNYDVYRIAFYTNLLDRKNTVPNKVSILNGVKTVYFTKKLNNEKEVDSIRAILEEKLFYNNDSIYYNSNYPEWVFIKNNETGKQVIVKDMWYKSLDIIIEKYKDRLD